MAMEASSALDAVASTNSRDEYPSTIDDVALRLSTIRSVTSLAEPDFPLMPKAERCKFGLTEASLDRRKPTVFHHTTAQLNISATAELHIYLC